MCRPCDAVVDGGHVVAAAVLASAANGKRAAGGSRRYRDSRAEAPRVRGFFWCTAPTAAFPHGEAQYITRVVL